MNNIYSERPLKSVEYRQDSNVSLMLNKNNEKYEKAHPRPRNSSPAIQLACISLPNQ